jgi:hypothetical protein
MMIWANLLHLSYNMWEDRDEPSLMKAGGTIPSRWYRPFLTFDEELWERLTKRMADVGMNMVVIDLGDGVRYESRPEIAVENAWSTAKLCNELDRLRDLGLEPIPKLNFATTHDAWLGEYSRCVSTPTYYQVCSDLIEEVIELFDTPRFFHLGMDEETAEHQKYYAYALMRQHELWWHDLTFLCDEVRKGKVRPWIWSDHIWRHRDEFLANVSRDVLQSNWYYGTDFADSNPHAEAYAALEAGGYDQIPTASNHSNPVNFGLTVEHCNRVVARERLSGYLQTPWRPTLAEFAGHHEAAIDQVGAVIAGAK